LGRGDEAEGRMGQFVWWFPQVEPFSQRRRRAARRGGEEGAGARKRRILVSRRAWRAQPIRSRSNP